MPGIGHVSQTTLADNATAYYNLLMVAERLQLDATFACVCQRCTRYNDDMCATAYMLTSSKFTQQGHLPT